MSYYNSPTEHRPRPHSHPVGAKFFITCRLFGSIPLHVIEQLQNSRNAAIKQIEMGKQASREERMQLIRNEHKRYFAKLDVLLDKAQFGSTWLKDHDIAQIVADKIHDLAAEGYFHLIAYCIMPNHVHMIIDTSKQLDKLAPNEPVTDENYMQVFPMMSLLKNNTGMLASEKLNLNGYFWQRDNYDHYIRSEQELQNIIGYVLQNPVKAGLVESWEQWKYNYISPDHLGLLEVSE
jgi:putative transposase